MWVQYCQCMSPDPASYAAVLVTGACPWQRHQTSCQLLRLLTLRICSLLHTVLVKTIPVWHFVVWVCLTRIWLILILNFQNSEIIQNFNNGARVLTFIALMLIFLYSAHHFKWLILSECIPTFYVYSIMLFLLQNKISNIRNNRTWSSRVNVFFSYI